MLGRAAAVCALLCLAGCGVWPFNDDSAADSWFRSSPAPQAAAAPLPAEPADVPCQKVAQQRADDAAINGLSQEDQQIAYSEAYGNCSGTPAPQAAQE